jgi:hypothetical protein|tara:strand:+ start:342 stop:710 length:369 start_codon:yes stop_codon:yes gene_type:complete
MTDFNILTHETIGVFAKRHYNNPSDVNEQEFEDDMKRFKYLKRLFRKYDTSKEFKARLIINHIIILANMFGVDASSTLLFFKIDPQHWSILKTILIFLNYMPEDELIDIEIDQNVMEELKRI